MRPYQPSFLNALFDVAGLSLELLFSIHPCKEEQISDEDFLESIGNNADEDDEVMACYPSECVLENMKQGNEMKSETKEEVIPGHPILFYFCLLVSKHSILLFLIYSRVGYVYIYIVV